MLTWIYVVLPPFQSSRCFYRGDLICPHGTGKGRRKGLSGSNWEDTAQRGQVTPSRSCNPSAERVGPHHHACMRPGVSAPNINVLLSVVSWSQPGQEGHPVPLHQPNPVLRVEDDSLRLYILKGALVRAMISCSCLNWCRG